MSIKGYAPTRRFGPIALTVSIVALSLLVFASVVVSRNGTTSESAELHIAIPSTANDPQRNRTLVESEVITITRRGFEPRAITRPAGRFILMIENPSWQDLNLRLSRESGESLNEVQASRQQPDWNEILDLQPGRYLLTEQNHPDWACQITITVR